jgi:TPR repeat protein
MYEFGTGVSIDVVEARKWYERASDGGHLDARVQLGLLFGSGPGADVARGLALVESAAAEGSGYANYQLGVIRLGNSPQLPPGDAGVRTDLAAALRAFEAGARLQHPACMGALGYLTLMGTGVDQDVAKGTELLRAGAEGGDADAQYWLAGALGDSAEPTLVRESIQWYARAADQGHLDAMNDLGAAKIRGLGTEPDADGALRLYDAAAKAGHRLAARNACEVHHGAVQKATALRRQLRLPVVPSAAPTRAREACERAFALGDEVIAVQLADLLVDATQGPPDARRARQVLEDAALRRHLPAMIPLAQGLADGEEPDLVSAMAWLTVFLRESTPEERHPWTGLERKLAGKMTEEQVTLVPERVRAIEVRLTPAPEPP